MWQHVTQRGNRREETFFEGGALPMSIMPRRLAIVRRWSQFGIRSLLLLTLVVSLALGWYANRVRAAAAKQEAIRAIQEAGGHVGIAKTDETSLFNRCEQFLGKSQFVTVERVSLGGTADDSRMELLRTMPELTKLDSEGKVTDRGLANLRYVPQLTELDLSGSAISDQGLAELRFVPELRRLWLSGAEIKGPGVRHLASLKSLEELWLDETVDGRGLLYLPSLPSLKSLILTDMRISDEALAAVKGLPSLELLRVVRTPITGTGLKYLRGTSVKDLNLSDTGVREGLEHLAAMPELEALHLNRCRSARMAIADIGRVTQLKELWLKDANIIDADLQQLGALTNLETLSLADNRGIDGSGLKFLAKLPKLRWVSLSETGVTDRALEGLSGARSLQFLNLSGTQITGSGLRYIRELPEIRMIVLNGTLVTDEQLVHLIGTQLRDVRLEGSHVSEAGIERLKKAMPSLQVGR